MRGLPKCKQQPASFMELTVELIWYALERLEPEEAVKDADLLALLARGVQGEETSLCEYLKDEVVRGKVSRSRQRLLVRFLDALKTSPVQSSPARDCDSSEERQQPAQKAPTPSPAKPPPDPRLDHVPTLKQLIVRFEKLQATLESDDPMPAIRAMPYHTRYFFERLGLDETCPVKWSRSQRTMQVVLAKADEIGSSEGDQAVVFELYASCIALIDDLETETDDKESEAESDSMMDVERSSNGSHSVTWHRPPTGYSEDDMIIERNFGGDGIKVDSQVDALDSQRDELDSQIDELDSQ